METGDVASWYGGGSVASWYDGGGRSGKASKSKDSIDDDGDFSVTTAVLFTVDCGMSDEREETDDDVNRIDADVSLISGASCSLAFSL